jgi:DNA repair exonuclease SbcCD ATPase subunit
MIIRRIRVRRFRGLADQELTFGPGLNVVRGRNDAGKSTLHLAFSAALFPVRPSEAKSYKPWTDEEGAGAGEVALEFEANGCRYELRKDFGTQRTALRSDAGACETPKEIAAQVGDLLGFGNLALFRATAHIGQWQLAAVQDESREIGAHLSRIMTGTDSDAIRVLKSISDWIRRQEVGLRGRPATAPGALRRGQDRLRALADERQRLDAEVKEIENAASERDRRAAQMTQLETAAAEDDALLAANRRLVELDRRWEEQSRRAREAAARLERVDAAARALDAAAHDPALAVPEVPDAALTAIRQSSARADVLRAQAAEADAEVARVRGLAQTIPGLSGSDRARTALGTLDRRLAAAAGAMGLGGLLLLAAHHPTPAAIVLAVAAIFGGAAMLARGRRRDLARLALHAAREAVEQADRTAVSLREQAGAASEHVQRTLANWEVVSLDALVARRTAADAASARRQAAAQVLEGLLGGQPREALAEAHRQLLLELGALQAQREEPDLSLKRLDAAAFQRLQLEAQQRRQTLEDAKAAVQRLEGRLTGRSPHEALARVEEELAETEARLTRQQRQVEVLRLTYDVLDRAHRATVVPGRARLEELASGYLRQLSGGAYDRITVDDETLAPRVWVGPPKEWADVSEREIGSGGVDQCYLALRLSLVDLLADGRRPPLFLDDPFLAYDDARQTSALAFLNSLARDRQIFLFTCRTAYDEYADHVAVLGPSRPPT